MSAGQTIIEGLKEALAGDFARVTIDGVTWVREPDQRTSDVNHLEKTEIMLKQAKRIHELEAELDAIRRKTIEECARAVECHPWPTKPAESLWGIERLMVADAIRALAQTR